MYNASKVEREGDRMYISHIAIKNFRNYRCFNMDLKPFVTIIGENNIGKSNLLDAISLVLTNDMSAHRNRSLEIDDFNIKVLSQFKNELITAQSEEDLEQIVFPEIRVDLYFSDMDLDQEAILEDCWYDNDLKIARISYVYTFKTSKRKKALNDILNIIQDNRDDPNLIELIDFPINGYEYDIVGGIHDHPVDRYDLRMLTMEYLDALRDAKRELNSNSDKKLLFKILNDRDSGQFKIIKEKIIDLEKAIKDDKNVLESLKKDIMDYLERISLQTETSSNKVNFQFTSIELAEILKKIGLQYGDEAVSIDRNGLGRNNLLYMAVVLAHLYEKENTFFRVVAIEEPEAHLCPIVQRHLSKNLKDEENHGKQQLIITTHSTHIASYLDLDKMVVLFKNNEDVCSHYLLEGFGDKAEDKKIIRYLQKWLNATNSTMFFSRKIILVEGIAEEILIPIFYEWEYGITLEKVNCQVVNVNGVAFKNFLEIVKNGYFVRTAVLTDSDEGKKTAQRAKDLKQQYEKDSKKILISITKHSNTFEKEIFQANKGKTDTKNSILRVLKNVRPNKCGDDFSKAQKDNYQTDVLFNCVEDYKSEFAFELSDYLSNQMAMIEDKMKMKKAVDRLKMKKKFVIPEYILEAFNFINEE